MKYNDALADLRCNVINSDPLRALLTSPEMSNAFLISPDGNAGDGLIQFGAINLLRHFGLDLPVLTISDIQGISSDNTLLISGGALIEGVWEDRMRAIRAYLARGGKVIFLGSTIYGFSDVFKLFGTRIKAFVRDLPSFDNCKSSGVESYLIHDLAFCVPADFFASMDRPGLFTLQCFRTDDERARPEIPFGSLDLSLLWNGSIWADAQTTAERCRILGSVISAYETIETDRLHIAIFAAALGRQVKLYNTAGGKTAAIYEHSLKYFDNVTFIQEEPLNTEGFEVRDRLLESARELARLRREWYEPELHSRANEIIRLQGNLEEITNQKKNVESLNRQLINDLAHAQARLIYNVTKSDTLIDKAYEEALELAKSHSAAGFDYLSNVDRPKDAFGCDTTSLSVRPSNGIIRVLKMVGYVLFPATKRRRAKRRSMERSIWRTK